MTDSELPKAIRGPLIGASILLAADVAVYGSFLFSVVVAPIWVLAASIKAILRRDDWRVSVARIAIPVVTLGLAFGNAKIQSRIAQANAEKIINAAMNYRSANGVLPRSLDALVPQYLDSVPRAKCALAFEKFKYSEFKGEHTLMYVDIPPFGRPYYNFEKARWGYLD